MPRFEPKPSSVSEPFWEATKSRQLRFQRCQDCDTAVWYPRLRCPRCISDRLVWTDAAGSGSVYTFNIMRRPGNPMMGDEVPYVVALVELDEGYRMLTNVTGCPPESVSCGQRVRVAWEVELSDGRRLPTFEPVGD